MEKTTLVVIDLQNAFINRRTASLAGKIKRHIELADYDFIIFSKFVNTPDSNFVKKLGWKKCFGPPETDIAIDLGEISKKYWIFEKNTYSVFKSKGFRNFLDDNKITKLYFCGLDLEACIMASVFDAFDLGYDYEILLDLCESSAKGNLTDCAKKIIGGNF